MGYQYFPFSQSQGYDPQTCADACNAQTTYDSENLAPDGSYMACVSGFPPPCLVLKLISDRSSSTPTSFQRTASHKDCIARCTTRHGTRPMGQIMDSIEEMIGIPCHGLIATRLCKSIDFLRFAYACKNAYFFLRKNRCLLL